MKITALQAAEWFVAHNNSVMIYNSAEEISNLKIQKLLYYAQGCSLASLGEALFDDEIVAWKHGPVIENVYKKYQHYGRKGIQAISHYPSIDFSVEKLLIHTYNSFARYSAWELANLTRREDPWKSTPLNEVIPLNIIKNYFAIHYADVNSHSDMIENIEYLREIEKYKENWDDEGAMPFGKDYIQEIVDLLSTMEEQPDVGPTGRDSIDFEYGSRKTGKKYLCLEIYEQDRSVRVYWKDPLGNRGHETIGMADVTGRVQRF